MPVNRGGKAGSQGVWRKVGAFPSHNLEEGMVFLYSATCRKCWSQTCQVPWRFWTTSRSRWVVSPLWNRLIMGWLCVPHLQTLVIWGHIFECYPIPLRAKWFDEELFRLEWKVIDFCIHRNAEDSRKKFSESIFFIFKAKEADTGKGDVICPLHAQLIDVYIVLCVVSSTSTGRVTAHHHCPSPHLHPKGLLRWFL